MDRRTERKLAFQIIFTLGFSKIEVDSETTLEEALNQFIFHQEIELNGDNKVFILSRYNGVCIYLNQIDDIISKNLKGWSLKRLNKVDLAILRLAVYEIYFEDIPKKVVVNEAVELAKLFSSDEGPSFINGILANLMKETAI